MNLNPQCFPNATLADLLKALRAGRTINSPMGIVLRLQGDQREIEVATHGGRNGLGSFPMTQQGLEDGIMVAYEVLDDDDETLIGWQVESNGETYKHLSDEHLSFQEAQALLREAAQESPDEEWSLLPVYAGEVPGSGFAYESARA